MPQVRAVFASLIAFCLSVSGLLAQAGKADATSGKSAVNVRSIHFDPVKLGGQQNPWIRTQVELHANFNPAAVAAAGETEAVVMALIQEAIQFHLEDLRLGGKPIPEPLSKSTFVEVGMAA